MRRRAGQDAGTVTAELAVCLPVLMMLLATALAAVWVAGARARAADAAREAARAVARGDPAAAARLIHAVAPQARLSTSSDGEDVIATVQVSVHPLASWLPAVTVIERAAAALEPAGVPP